MTAVAGAAGPEQGIDVLLCTFRRPQVAETLASLDAQALPADWPVRIVVSDNDDTPSGREVVERAAAGMRREVVYLHAPARNISIARNAGLDAATAGLVALIDDDETAPPDWLARLVAGLERTGADAVFGPVEALYGPDAPAWMREQDHHSNVPVRRGSEVTTGHSCNALLRWRGTAWQGERFDVALGRSGGEDTEFFFRLRRLGARYEIAGDARVIEPVDPRRLSFTWLRKRKFRMGQTYARSAVGARARIALFATAAAKAGYCLGRAALKAGDRGASSFWLLRGALHAGVCAGCLADTQANLYGN